MIIVVTGMVGLEKKSYLEKVCQLANQKGKKVLLCNVGDLMYAEAADITKGKMALVAVSKIMEKFSGIHTTSGLSNISFGLPKRRIINRFFLSMMVAYGLDSAILNPLDQKMIEAIKTADMLAGNDGYCRNFLNAVRAGQIVD